MGWRGGGWRGGLARRVKGIKRMKHGVKKGGRGAVKGHTRGFISEKGCKDCSRATTLHNVFSQTRDHIAP